MNVLVTGGAGFLGGYVMATLAKQGHRAARLRYRTANRGNAGGFA